MPSTASQRTNEELHGQPVRPFHAGLIFLACSMLSLLSMTAVPGTYDEGITLTGAMRVAAGQVPHRDFYAIYGPAHFYLLAGLFRVFGESMLVERAFFALISGLIVMVVFVIASKYCERRVMAAAVVVTMLLLFALNSTNGSAIFPASLCNLLAIFFVLPAFVAPLSIRRGIVAGGLAGVASLFRYDTGIAVFLVQICLLGLVALLGAASFADRLKRCISAVWPVAVGFAVVTAPTVLAYLSVARFKSFYFDIVLFPSKYYRRGRALPLFGMGVGIHTIGDYVALLAAILALAVGLHGVLRKKGQRDAAHHFLVSFGLLALVMYLKGVVRLGLAQEYMAILPAVLLLAVLMTNRSALDKRTRWITEGISALTVLVIATFAFHTEQSQRAAHRWIPQVLSASHRGTLSAIDQEWCNTPGPLTSGFCFLPNDGKIDAIEFVRTHTLPEQTLFVGNTHHDRIYANDNLIYFAAQRMPATHWSHFDPFLQNGRDTQEKMIEEFEASRPPYILLDSEFESNREPNGSSISSGVTLLDDYIHSQYKLIETFGDMQVWQRQ